MILSLKIADNPHYEILDSLLCFVKKKHVFVIIFFFIKGPFFKSTIFESHRNRDRTLLLYWRDKNFEFCVLSHYFIYAKEFCRNYIFTVYDRVSNNITMSTNKRKSLIFYSDVKSKTLYFLPWFYYVILLLTRTLTKMIENTISRDYISKVIGVSILQEFLNRSLCSQYSNDKLIDRIQHCTFVYLCLLGLKTRVHSFKCKMLGCRGYASTFRRFSNPLQKHLPSLLIWIERSSILEVYPPSAL